MLVTTAKTIVLVGGILGGLAMIGYPVKRLLERLRSPLCAPTMVIGLAIVQVVAWHWLELGLRGLAWPMNVLLAAAIVFALVDVARRRGEILRVDQRAVRRAAASLSIGFLIVAFNWSAVLSLPLVTTADSGNNDAVSYAVSAEHLVTGGFDDPGPMVGNDLGAKARVDAFGSLALIGSVSAVSRLGSWRVNESTLFALIILTTYGLAIFIDTLLGGDRWLFASVAAGATSCTLLFVLLQVQFFVGQIMAMAVVPLLAVAAFRFNEAGHRRQLLGPLVSATAVCLVMLSHYAHMLVLGAPLFVLPVVLERHEGDDWSVVVRRGLRTARLMIVSVAAAFVLVPVWLTQTLDLIRHNADVEAGFPLPGFTPTELMGLLRKIPTVSTMRDVWSVVTVVVIVTLALAVRGTHRRLVRYFTIFAIGVSLSYAAVYIRESGPGYRQWKWITFFQPSLVVLVVTIGALAVERLVATRTGRKRGIAVATVLVFGVVASANTGAVTALRHRRGMLFASADHQGLSNDPMLRGLTAVNIHVNAYWDTMWAVYFLPDKTLYLESPSYYEESTPRAEWTLVARKGVMHGASVHDVNSLFRLLREDPAGPLSDDASALAGAVSVSLDPTSLASGQITGSLSAANIGRGGWLSGDAAIGGVSVGVGLEDQDGRVLDSDWSHVSLITMRNFALPPDSTTDVEFSLPALPAGHYRLAFQLVSEHVGSFGTPSVEDAVVP